MANIGRMHASCRLGRAGSTMADFFNVVFAGQVVPGSDPAAVKANIARLFKANEAMVEKLFRGTPI